MDGEHRELLKDIRGHLGWAMIMLSVMIGLLCNLVCRVQEIAERPEIRVEFVDGGTPGTGDSQ